ncbi:MAG: hypothetical protein H7A51_10980 [Akkermansiaceae bacterium]|nr:hypothetical protein [Akkermansiaceae bacterium]
MSMGGCVNGQVTDAADSWPTSFRPIQPAVIKLIRSGGDGRDFIYRTKHFELHSATALSEHHLSQFATTAESVPSVLSRLPLPLLGMPTSSSGKQNPAKVLIYPDEESFVQAGGAQGAAGYYSGRKQAILLRADTFLRVKPPPGSRLPPKADYDLLVHEFTHLCMHRDLAYLPVWFTEGTAEYIAATHENRGVYQFGNVSLLISRHIKRHLPLDKEHIILPGIVETMALSHNTWRAHVESGPAEDVYRNYATSLLLTHYLFHGGAERRHATRLFLEKIRQRKALAQQVEILIPAASRETLQKNIVDYWKTRGLRIKFQPIPDPR